MERLGVMVKNRLFFKDFFADNKKPLISQRLLLGTRVVPKT